MSGAGTHHSFASVMQNLEIEKRSRQQFIIDFSRKSGRLLATLYQLSVGSAPHISHSMLNSCVPPTMRDLNVLYRLFSYDF